MTLVTAGLLAHGSMLPVRLPRSVAGTQWHRGQGALRLQLRGQLRYYTEFPLGFDPREKVSAPSLSEVVMPPGVGCQLLGLRFDIGWGLNDRNIVAGGRRLDREFLIAGRRWGNHATCRRAWRCWRGNRRNRRRQGYRRLRRHERWDGGSRKRRGRAGHLRRRSGGIAGDNARVARDDAFCHVAVAPCAGCHSIRAFTCLGGGRKRNSDNNCRA